MQLNDAQQHAAEAGGGPQLILAGAGSGKTRTIIHRIGHLIAADGIAPHRILAVTFTNKAAAELRARLSLLIGDGGGGVVSGTFHAISLSFLRRHAEVLAYPKSFQVIDADDQKALIKRLLKARNISSDILHPGYLLAWIEHCKHAALTAETAAVQTWNDIDMRELYAAYQQELVRHERMDFSDLILNTVRLLNEHADVAALLRARFDHVLVDEYQDTNPAQHMWLQLLCSEHRNLTVVGDDDQSIYGWRGADVRHILNFEDVWPGAMVHRLEYNYRSTAAILDLANAVIAGNADRHIKQLRAIRDAGETPFWQVCQDEYDEARRIAAVLRHWHRQGVAWREMVVLYRTARQSLPIEQMLNEADVPYRVIGGVGFFERMEIKDALAYWALLHRVADALHLRRIANKPKRGIGAVGEQRIVEMLSVSGMRAADWLDTLADGGVGPAAKLSPLARLIREQRVDAMQQPDMGLGRLLQDCGYLESLQAMGEIEVAARRENIQALQDYIAIAAGEGITPIEFLDRAALLQSGEQVNRGDGSSNDGAGDGADDETVSLMSLHRAKGLEFTAVVLSGVEEGLLPHQRSLDEGPGGLSEERRLLYVGMTRAKDYLLLTSARMRRSFGDMQFPQPSRFIARLSQQILARETVVTEVVSPGEGCELNIGSAVRHPSFGEGVILGVEGAGDAVRVSVEFRHAGTKRLMLKYAALEII
ncbi:MAG: UvrD-helicase domain-containing protein [Mariprofundaceae bacterium]|nr:UvrD-helicase domain-containing protein [Mariprofundaceae bacterium]